MKKGKGSIIISRLSSSKKEDEVRISLRDELSGVVFCDVSMSIPAYGSAVSAPTMTPMEFVLRPDYVGMKCESKTELVPCDLSDVAYKDYEKAAQKALKPFETDEWKGDWRDIGNHHRGSSQTGWRVGFRRYVPLDNLISS